MNKTGYLGKFVPFKADDPSILMSASLMSENDLGGGVVTGTPDYHATKGLALGGASGSRLTFTNLVKTLTDLDTGCTVQFEVTAEHFFSLSASNLEYLFTYGTGAKSLFVQGTGEPDVQVQMIAKTISGGTQYKSAYLGNYKKSESVQLHASFRRGYIDLFIDHTHVAIYPNDETAIANLFGTCTLFGLSGQNFSFRGYIKNLQVLNRPTLPLPKTHYSRTTIIGDSLARSGNYESQKSGNFRAARIGNETAQSGSYNEAGMTGTLRGYLSALNKDTDVRCYGTGSTGVTPSIAAGDVISQVNGNPVPHVEVTGSGDALETKPQIIVIQAGHNDALSAGYVESSFKTAYQKHH